jgi:hypothetical protein
LSAFSKSTFRLNTSRLFSPNSGGYESIIAQRLASSPAELVRKDFSPHGGVALAWEAREREVCLVGPAGSGKSRGWLERLHRDALAWPKSRQLIVRLTRKSLTSSAMVTLEDEVFPAGTFGDADSGHPLRFHSGDQSYLYPNGAVIGVVGLDDPGSVFSSQWDRVYCQEVNQLAERPYSTLLRALRNNVMPWQQIVSDMNPQIESHWMHRRCDEGAAREVLATHADNPSNTAEYLAGLRALKGSELESLYYGRRVTEVEGSYYGEQLREMRAAGHVREVPHDPALRVYTAFDLGIDDYMAIWWFQRVGREWHWLDYYEASGMALPDCSVIMQERGRANRYNYGPVYFPHDGAARELGTGKTRQETMQGLGWQVRIVPVQRLEDQHAAVRLVVPVSYFDAARCATGLQRLGGYHKAQDPSTGLYLGRPVHDEASHGASAFATAVLSNPVESAGTPPARRQPTPF